MLECQEKKGVGVMAGESRSRFSFCGRSRMLPAKTSPPIPNTPGSISLFRVARFSDFCSTVNRSDGRSSPLRERCHSLQPCDGFRLSGPKRPINRPNPDRLSGVTAGCSHLQWEKNLSASASELLDVAATEKDFRTTARAFDVFSHENVLLFGHY